MSKDFDMSSSCGPVRIVGTPFLAEDRVVTCGSAVRFHEIDPADIRHAVEKALWMDANSGHKPDRVYVASDNAARLKRIMSKLSPKWIGG